MRQNMMLAFENYLHGVGKLTNQKANAEINANWSRIWDIAQSLGMTKGEAQKASWAYFKHDRLLRMAKKDERAA